MSSADWQRSGRHGGLQQAKIQTQEAELGIRLWHLVFGDGLPANCGSFRQALGPQFSDGRSPDHFHSTAGSRLSVAPLVLLFGGFRFALSDVLCMLY